MDKIRILLIDDSPSSLSLRDPDTGLDLPKIREHAGFPMPGIEKYFDLVWLPTLDDCRKFLDLSWELGQRHPLELGLGGFVPEIICFDYAMSGDTSPSSTRMNRDHPIYPINRLEILAQEHGIDLRSETQLPKPVGRGGNLDSDGCYAGSLIYLIYGDHPCAPIATTAYNDRPAEGDVAMFEWLLGHIAYHTFDGKGRRDPRWDQLLKLVLPNLRDRIERLILSGIIHVSLDQIIRMSGGEDVTELTIESRFGQRDYPVEGLFLEISESERRSKQKEWARRILSSLFTTPDGWKPITEARELADYLWRAYSETPANLPQKLQDLDFNLMPHLRSNLSRLITKDDLNDVDKSLLADLKEYFGVVKDQAGEDWICTKHLCYLNDKNPDVLVRRWAVLLIMIRLLELKEAGLKMLHNFETESDIDTDVRRRLSTPIDADEVLFACFPSPPEAVVTNYHFKEKYPNLLSRSGKKIRDNTYELGLKLDHVLEQCTGLNPLKGEYGVSRGELYLMQCYALERGIPKEKWPVWLKFGVRSL